MPLRHAKQTLQMISNVSGTIIVFDLKGDSAYFQGFKGAAKVAGRPFKRFTNNPNNCTSTFINPWRLAGPTLQAFHQLYNEH